MPKLFLASSKIRSTYKKREVVKYTTNLIIDNYNKFNFQEHREVSPSIPLERKYTKKYV